MKSIGCFKSLALICTLVFAHALLAAPESEPVLAVVGDVPTRHHYTISEIQSLPQTTVSAKDHDGSQAEYKGVLVEEFLKRAGVPLGEKLRGPALTTAVVVHAADGYQAVFSLAELDHAVNAQPALLAWNRNGEPLASGQGPLRLVVPADKRQARWVRQVTAIEIVSVKRPPITKPADGATDRRP